MFLTSVRLGNGSYTRLAWKRFYIDQLGELTPHRIFMGPFGERSLYLTKRMLDANLGCM